eukprot:3270371-Rhodomonas_salina.1
MPQPFRGGWLGTARLEVTPHALSVSPPSTDCPRHRNKRKKEEKNKGENRCSVSNCFRKTGLRTGEDVDHGEGGLDDAADGGVEGDELGEVLRHGHQRRRQPAAPHAACQTLLRYLSTHQPMRLVTATSASDFTPRQNGLLWHGPAV